MHLASPASLEIGVSALAVQKSRGPLAHLPGRAHVGLEQPRAGEGDARAAAHDVREALTRPPHVGQKPVQPLPGGLIPLLFCSSQCPAVRTFMMVLSVLQLYLTAVSSSLSFSQNRHSRLHEDTYTITGFSGPSTCKGMSSCSLRAGPDAKLLPALAS